MTNKEFPIVVESIPGVSLDKAIDVDELSDYSDDEEEEDTDGESPSSAPTPDPAPAPDPDRYLGKSPLFPIEILDDVEEDPFPPFEAPSPPPRNYF